MSSDSDTYLPDEIVIHEEEDDPEPIPIEHTYQNLKDKLYILHKGNPSQEPSPFSKISATAFIKSSFPTLKLIKPPTTVVS